MPEYISEDKSSGTYTFENVQADHTIAATFKQAVEYVTVVFGVVNGASDHANAPIIQFSLDNGVNWEDFSTAGDLTVDTVLKGTTVYLRANYNTDIEGTWVVDGVERPAWYKESCGYLDLIGYKADADMDIRAITRNYREREHKVSYDIDGGTGTAPAEITVEQGKEFTLASYTGTKTGFTFGGWSYNDNTYQPGTTMVMGDSDITFKAKWSESADYRTITFVCNSVDRTNAKLTYTVGSGQPQTVTFIDGTSKEFQVPRSENVVVEATTYDITKDRLVFDCWYVSTDGGSDQTITNPVMTIPASSSDVQVRIVYSKVYFITVTEPDHGTITVDAQHSIVNGKVGVKAGNNVTFTIKSDDGWIIDEIIARPTN